MSIRLDDEVMSLAGELDLASCPELRSALARCADLDDLHIDLAHLSFIDAAGIGCLIDQVNQRRAAGQTVTLGQPTSHVARVLSIVELGALVTAPARHHALRDSGASASTPRTRHLLWRSAFFSIAAFLSSSPPSVHIVADGDFSGPGSAVLHGALDRVSRFRVPVVIDAAGVTKLSAAAAALLDAHLNAVQNRLEAASPAMTDDSAALYPEQARTSSD